MGNISATNNILFQIINLYPVFLGPNYADDALLQRLENCDPNTNPDCKRSLGDVSEQLLAQLGNDDAKAVNNAKAEQLSENEPNQDNDDSKTSTSGKNHPVQKSNDDDDNSGDIPDVYFLSKYLHT